MSIHVKMILMQCIYIYQYINIIFTSICSIYIPLMSPMSCCSSLWCAGYRPWHPRNGTCWSAQKRCSWGTHSGIVSKIHWTFRESLGKLQGFLGKVWGFLGKIHLKLSGNFRDTVREDSMQNESVDILGKSWKWYIYIHIIYIYIYI